MRAAEDFGRDPMVLTGCVWPGWRVWTLDRDRRISQFRLKELTDYLEVPPDYFNSSFLYPYISQTTSREIGNNGVWPWLLPYGIRNRRTSGGIQFCPLCLKTDAIPYFRVKWRFAWTVVCDEHSVMLCDRCPACFAPIDFYHGGAIMRVRLSHCKHCDFNLADAEAACASEENLLLEHRLTKDLAQDFTNWSGERFQLSEIFTYLRIIIGFSRKAANNKNSKFTDFLLNAGISEQSLIPTSTGLNFESLNIEDRSRLLGIAHSIVSLSRQDVEKLVTDHKIMSHHLKDITPESSSILGNLVASKSANKNKQRKSPKKNKRPASKHSVKQKEARLLRRAGLCRR